MAGLNITSTSSVTTPDIPSSGPNVGAHPIVVVTTILENSEGGVVAKHTTSVNVMGEHNITANKFVDVVLTIKNVGDKQQPSVSPEKALGGA